MKKLIENEFIGTGEVKDFKFTRIAFSKYADLYEVNRGGTQVHFEVFKRKFAPVCINFENRIYSETEFKQVFPKSKDFGVWAWCITDKKRAIQKFNELINEDIKGLIK